MQDHGLEEKVLIYARPVHLLMVQINASLLIPNRCSKLTVMNNQEINLLTKKVIGSQFPTSKYGRFLKPDVKLPSQDLPIFEVPCHIFNKHCVSFISSCPTNI